MIADLQGRNHRARRNLERLHDKSADEQRQEERRADRFRLCAEGRFTLDILLAVHRGSLFDFAHFIYGHKSLPDQTFKAARKASWGISTLPTCFMRFFPSFCRSSSLRLRVMSPPFDLAVAASR